LGLPSATLSSASLSSISSLESSCLTGGDGCSWVLSGGDDDGGDDDGGDDDGGSVTESVASVASVSSAVNHVMFINSESP